MTTFTDDFNRADSSDLGAGWVEVSGDWSIISQQLSTGVTGGTIALRVATAMATSDNYAQVTIAATTSVSQGVWCRGNSDITSGYVWRNNGSSWNLFSVVADVFTSIGSFAAAAAPGDVAKVQAVGSTIKAFVNGVERVSVTNTDVATGTTVGIRSEANSALRFDDFTGADVSGTVTGSALAAFGGLAGAASGVRTVVGTAAGALGGLAGTAAGVRTVTGSAAAVFGGLTATGSDSVPGASEQGSWYGLLDILREGAALARDELQRDPVACDCGEPLRTGPNSELFCPFDGSIWETGGRLAGHVSTAVRR